MNYIHQLMRENVCAAAETLDLYTSLDRFKAKLQTDPKFNGTQGDGSRKDWIATADVIHWIKDVTQSATIAADDAAREFDRIQAAKPTLNRHLKH